MAAPDTTNNAQRLRELAAMMTEKGEQAAAAKRNIYGLPVLATESDTQPGKSALWMDNGLAGVGQVAVSTGEFPCVQTTAIAALVNVAAGIPFDEIAAALKARAQEPLDD